MSLQETGSPSRCTSMGESIGGDGLQARAFHMLAPIITLTVLRARKARGAPCLDLD